MAKYQRRPGAVQPEAQRLRREMSKLASKMGVSTVGVSEKFKYRPPTMKDYKAEDTVGRSYTEFLEDRLTEMELSYDRLRERAGGDIDFTQKVTLKTKKGGFNPDLDFDILEDVLGYNQDLVQTGQRVSRYVWISHGKFIDLMNPDEVHIY